MANTQVKTKYGLISGEGNDGYVIYRGIPYAKPPVGDRRWKAPEEPDVFEGVYEAVLFADKCKQREHTGGMYKKEFYSDPAFDRNASEDCLYLNIWTPADAPANPEKKYPVAMWIHGGAFGGGYSSEQEFDGASYAARGVILVTVSYRLNIFGFLAHPWLSAENEHSVSGNYGILDQMAALKWIYENISAFGGDPENITVFGQSAGCMSTQDLICSDLTGNMIAKAVLMSGMCVNNKDMFAVPDLQEAYEIGARFVEIAGAESLAELRAMTTDEVFAAGMKLEGELMERGKGPLLVPIIDGCVLKEHVGDSAASGRIKNIPYMAGTVAKDIGGDDPEGGRGPLAAEAVAFSLACEKNFGSPAYVYYFSRPLPGDDEGAFHSSELWYVFGTLDRCWRPMELHDYTLSGQMLDAWTSFMKDGKPSSDPGWLPCTKDNTFVKEFN